MAVKTKQLPGQLKYFKQIQHRDNKYEQSITNPTLAMYSQTPARSLSFSNILILMTNILYIITIASVGMSWWKSLGNKPVQVTVCIIPVTAVWPLNCKVTGSISCREVSIKYIPVRRSGEAGNLTYYPHLFEEAPSPPERRRSAPVRMSQAKTTGSNTSASVEFLSSVKQTTPDI